MWFAALLRGRGPPWPSRKQAPLPDPHWSVLAQSGSLSALCKSRTPAHRTVPLAARKRWQLLLFPDAPDSRVSVLPRRIPHSARGGFAPLPLAGPPDTRSSARHRAPKPPLACEHKTWKPLRNLRAAPERASVGGVIAGR